MFRLMVERSTSFSLTGWHARSIFTFRLWFKPSLHQLDKPAFRLAAATADRARGQEGYCTTGVSAVMQKEWQVPHRMSSLLRDTGFSMAISAITYSRQ